MKRLIRFLIALTIFMSPATVFAYGGSGGAGGAANSSSTGSAGSAGDTGGSQYTGGAGGGGGGGSADGGAGGSGAGGGLLLKTTSGSVSITGSVDARGGGASTSDGGTVKIFNQTTCTSISGVHAGRIYQTTSAGNCPPDAPTLNFPINSSNGNSVYTTFQLRTTDPEGDYLEYWIDVCSNNTCSSIVRSVCQYATGTGVPGTCTASQTGWAGQDKQSGTAYTGSTALTLSTLATLNYQPPLLSPSTQYWWRGYAIDPGGSNTWSTASTINTFTTAPTETHIQGNVRIQGNVKL